MEDRGKTPFRVRSALPLTLCPFLCGIGTANVNGGWVGK
jgi:hypothetical protein